MGTRAYFHGRPIGSIGLARDVTLDFEGELTVDQAEAKVRETHEHLSWLRVTHFQVVTFRGESYPEQLPPEAQAALLREDD